jgi:hypothetical protein
MAITLTTASISTGQTIEAGHVTQSAVAFTGGEAYDITISGSLTTTGTDIMSSSASPSITSILTDNDSHPFITGVTTTGPNFRMNLADADTSGSAYMALGRQTGNFGGTGFTAHYATGSNASQGEIVMSIGKNGQLGEIQDRFIVQSEPGPIGSNTFSELSLFAGTHTNNLRVVQGVVQNGTGDFANFSAGNQDIATGFKKHVFLQYSFNNTSSFAGFASSSLNTGSTARNFNANSIPFGIDAGVSDSDTAFFIDRGGTFGASAFVTASFEISKGGSINMEGSITASRASFTDGIQSFTSTASIADLVVDPRGDILKAGNTTTTAGLCYFLSGSNFIEIDLGGSALIKSGSMNNLLAIAIGTNSGTDGMLLKGFCNHNLNTGQAEVGKRFYVDSGGRFSGTPNSDPTLVRIAGYTVEGNNKIYFNPQQTTL